MLVPHTRLLVCVGLVATPFAIVGGAVPDALPVSAAVVALLAVAVLVDAILGLRRLDGVEVRLPSLVRMHKDRPGSLELAIRHPALTSLALRIGLPFSQTILTPHPDLRVMIPAGTPDALVQWPCTPIRRGPDWLRSVYFETCSHLGFWLVRKSQPAACELRVYPNLMDERKNVAALFLKRAAVGARAMRQAGQGREFEKLRDYVHNDSMDDIHWKASAKRGYPVTKVFQVERTQEVYVVVDTSRLTGRELTDTSGPVERPTTVLERFVTAALILGWAAEQQGDQFGLITFSDKVISFVRAKRGQAHYDACREQLYALESEPVAPDFEALCSFIRLKLRKRALLIVLTALEDPHTSQAFSNSVELISRQHLVMVDMLNPPGAEPLFEQPVTGVDEIYRHLGGHLQWHQLRELQKTLRRRGIRLSLMDGARLPAELVAQHADIKARQLL